MAATPQFMLGVPAEQHTNGAKLSRLIFDEGTVALRSLFDRYHPPASLIADLKSNYKTLLSLLQKKLISQTQWELLFPTDANLPCSQNMDIHLLFLLLHNICGLTEPIFGWNSPSSSDNSLEGNIARFEWYINEVAQRMSSAGVQTTQFNFYWDEITTALKILGVYNSTCEELKTKPLNRVDAKMYHMLLVNWAVRDKDLQHQLQRIDSASEKKDIMVTSIQQVQDETLKAMQDLTIGKMPFTWFKSSIIGTGCKGTKVFRGQLTSSGKAVAVKKMYSGVFDMKEAEKLRRCHHPNIIRCFATYEEEEFFFIALELCDKTLKECIDEDEFTSADISRGKCLLQVTSGVVYLHENKICHRDIKPDNILLTIKNDEYTHHRFVLADFNCARDVPSGESFSTQHRTVGTAGWMAPEVQEAGQRRTLKIDVFSLGCVFYYTLSNKKHPFGDINNGDKCQSTINTSKYGPTLERGDFVENVCLCELIGRMVNRNQERRPKSSEVHSHLVQKLADEDLYRKVTSILKKLTPQTFQTLTNQILELEIDTPERLEGVIDRIFEKAIFEPRFSVACANMCRCLMPVEEKVGEEARMPLRKILLNKCQKIFEEDKSEEYLSKMESQLAEYLLSEDEAKLKKAERVVDKSKMRSRSLGNIRFIGELFKLKMLTENVMHDCVVRLLRSTDDKSYEYLCILLTTIGKDLDHEKAKPRVDQYFDQINEIIQAERTSWRVRFMLMDVVDLRERCWIAMTEDHNGGWDSPRKVGVPQALDGSQKFQDISEQQLKRSANAWVRRKDQEQQSSERQTKTDVLYRKVINILNKLTPQKFQTLTNQILELEIDTPERLEGVIDRIFEKAISEPRFSIAYANMCRCLMAIKVKVHIEGKDGKEAHVSFRKILLNKCQKEFEKEKSEENLVHAKMDALAQQGLSENELKLRKAQLEVEEIKLRGRSLGNIRFIGELFKLKMLTENIMHDCVVKLLRNTDEESCECLCILLTTIGKDLDHKKAKPRVDQYFDDIYKIIQSRTSSRVRFMMIDVVDLRKSGWVPRREDNNPKTIDQIHKEAQEQEKKTKGASFSRRATRPRPPRSLIVAERAKERENRLAENGTKALINELHSTGSIEKAVKGFEDMKYPSKHHLFVSTAVKISVDYAKRSSDRHATGKLFSALLKCDLLTMQTFYLSLRRVLVFLEDIELDVPYIWRYFAEVIGIPVADGFFPMKTLGVCANKIHQKTSACKMLGEVLVTVAKCSSDENFSSLWTNSRLQWSTFFASENEAKDFLKRKQLKRSENALVRPKDKEHLSAEQAKTDSMQMPTQGAPQHMISVPTGMQHQPGFTGQPRLQGAHQQFYQPTGRTIRIRPSHQPPQQNPMYSSPPTGPMMQFVSPQGTPTFIPQQQQHVQTQNEYNPAQVVGGQLQFRQVVPQQVPGQFASMPSPAFSQQQSPYGMPQTTVYTQPQQPFYIFKTPQTPVSLPQQQPPRPPEQKRERKIIQIRDPNQDYGDITQEILMSVAHSGSGTPNSTPDASGRSSKSNTPPVNSHIDAGAQFAAQVAAALANDKPSSNKSSPQTSKPASTAVTTEVAVPLQNNESKFVETSRGSVVAVKVKQAKVQPETKVEKKPQQPPSTAEALNPVVEVAPAVKEVTVSEVAKSLTEVKQDEVKPTESKLVESVPNSSDIDAGAQVKQDVAQSETKVDKKLQQHSPRIKEELRELILKKGARNQEVFEWIEKNVKVTNTKQAPFIRDLVTAVCEASMTREGTSTSFKCDEDLLKSRKNLLQKYIDGNSQLELQALYALQSLFVALDHPPGFLKSFFDTLYDEEIISEDSFYSWESSKDSAEDRGKGHARRYTSEFFHWLRSAPEESSSEED